MKKVELAGKAGFCFGVKRAVDKVYEQAHKENVYTFGPIIHNEEVVADLERRGVKVVDSIEQLDTIPKGTMIIRSHGVSKEIYDSIQDKGFDIIDATCPFVLKIHNIVKKAGDEGRSIIIIGNDNHPEVEGIKGWAQTPVYIIDSVEKAHNFVANDNEKLCLVSQTTFNHKKFQELVEIISKKLYDINISNTICNATEERQKEAACLAAKVDAMLVIGGKSSSNTRKLYEICRNECENTYYIQTYSDLKQCDLSAFEYIGITAGASTPNNIIEEVQTHVRNEF